MSGKSVSGGNSDVSRPSSVIAVRRLAITALIVTSRSILSPVRSPSHSALQPAFGTRCQSSVCHRSRYHSSTPSTFCRELDNAELQRLIGARFGRTTLCANRLNWAAAQVVHAYSGQEHVERVFHGLRGGNWLGWGSLQHWTDSKIQVHAFFCMLGISLLHYLHKQVETVWPDLSMENLLDELRRMQQFELRYAGPGGKGKPRVETVLSKQTLAQQCLAQVLELNQVLGGASG